MMITFLVSVQVQLQGRPGRHSDFDDWKDIGVVHAKTLRDALDQIGGDLKQKVQVGHCGFMNVDNVHVCIQPITEIADPADLLKRYRKTIEWMVDSGRYLPPEATA